mgnify:CR=1 FL=1
MKEDVAENPEPAVEPVNYCWLCPLPLVDDNVTGEHVIPGAIGGHKEVRRFICRTCNSTRGTSVSSPVKQTVDF